MLTTYDITETVYGQDGNPIPNAVVKVILPFPEAVVDGHRLPRVQTFIADLNGVVVMPLVSNVQGGYYIISEYTADSSERLHQFKIVVGYADALARDLETDVPTPGATDLTLNALADVNTADAEVGDILRLQEDGSWTPEDYRPEVLNVAVNGDMRIAQRGDEFLAVPLTPVTAEKTLDKWSVLTDFVVGDATANVRQRQDATGSYMEIEVNTPGTIEPTNNQIELTYTWIEKNLLDSLDTDKLVADFRFQSDVLGTYTVIFIYKDNDFSLSWSSTHEIEVTVANTWQDYRIELPPIPMLAVSPAQNDAQLLFGVVLNAANSIKTGVNSAWSQTGIGFGNVSVNQVNFFDTVACVCGLTGVEIKDTTLPATSRPFGEELELCKRYYQKSYNYELAPGDTVSSSSGLFNHYQPNIPDLGIRPGIGIPVDLRAIPVFTAWNPETGVAGSIYNKTTDTDYTVNFSFASEKTISNMFTTPTPAVDSIYQYHWTVDAEYTVFGV